MFKIIFLTSTFVIFLNTNDAKVSCPNSLHHPLNKVQEHILFFCLVQMKDTDSCTVITYRMLPQTKNCHTILTFSVSIRKVLNKGAPDCFTSWVAIIVSCKCNTADCFMFLKPYWVNWISHFFTDIVKNAAGKHKCWDFGYVRVIPFQQTSPSSFESAKGTLDHHSCPTEPVVKLLLFSSELASIREPLHQPWKERICCIP